VLIQKGNLTVGAELVDAEQDAQVWGERYSRRIEDLFSVHEEIAREIAGRLRLRIGEREQQLLTRRATGSHEAFQLFLRAWHHANQWTPEGLRKAIEYCWRALQEDPSYADPYALLAYIYSILGMLGVMRPADVLPKAKAAALNAVERNEHAGSPRVALALVRLLYEWDWRGARQELERAFQLDPGDPYCRLCYGVWLNAMGQAEEAIREMKVALDMDPLSILISHNLAGVYYGAGLEDHAIEQHLRTLELNPAFPAAHGQLAILYSRRGACDKALDAAERFLSLSGRDLRSRCFLAMVYANCGMRAEATACVESLEKETPFHGTAGFAFVYAALADRERAFACLEKSYEERDVFLAFLPILPEFRSLHGDPRFTDLLRRIGLPAHTSAAAAGPV
jgi:tetratricopeptide (TPR) repeat protein